jgi:hypothetical protein
MGLPCSTFKKGEKIMKIKIMVALSMVMIFITMPPSYAKENGSLTGYLDSARYEKGFFKAFGWAADNKEGAPVKKVMVYIDKKLVGQAKLGLARPDVTGAMKKSDWGKSGWELGVKISLNKGMHTAYAVAYNKKDAKKLLINEKSFKVE